ncbi:ERV/ALR sulfhydryl oxidase domain-containing protein [Cytidiella melzeri]|nr:ERV/ALR sulfhydryl oxidase domain-containing protein [Cytidiella melzeri]
MISRFTKAFFFIVLGLFLLASLAMLHAPSRAYIDPWTGDLFGEGGVEQDLRISPNAATVAESVHGGVIMSKLGNATAKAELGRATWKLLHTMTLRFPEKPTQDERDALGSYFHLLSRLYPCGECATEFQLLLKKYPPQTSSRRAAATWLCFVHNQVNTRLRKAEFDCANLDATYDCGCGDTPIASSRNEKTNTLDFEGEIGKDGITGVGIIKGGR